MTVRSSLRRGAPLCLAAVLLASCAGGNAPTETDVDETAPDPAEDAEEDPGAEPEEEPADEASEDPAEEAASAELPDVPQAYSSLLVDGEPSVATTDGEVTLTWGPSGRDAVPFIAHNGTDGPISRLEISGTITDEDGETITSGQSQSVQPNVIEAGDYAIGFVYGGPNELEGSAAVLEDPAVDYTEGLGEFENIIVLDVDELEETGGSFTGQVSNPHDIEVTGPVDVTLACLDDTGDLEAIFSAFADRDTIEEGGSSSFTAETYGEEADCSSYLVGASGYTDDF